MQLKLQHWLELVELILPTYRSGWGFRELNQWIPFETRFGRSRKAEITRLQGIHSSRIATFSSISISERCSAEKKSSTHVLHGKDSQKVGEVTKMIGRHSTRMILPIDVT